MPTTDKETVLAKYPAARCIPNYNGLNFAIRNKQKEAGLSSWQATEAKAWAGAAYRVKNGQRFSGEYVPTATFYSVYPPPPPGPPLKELGPVTTWFGNQTLKVVGLAGVAFGAFILLYLIEMGTSSPVTRPGSQTKTISRPHLRSRGLFLEVRTGAFCAMIASVRPPNPYGYRSH